MESNNSTLNVMQEYVESYLDPLLKQHLLPAVYIKCDQEFYQFLKSDGVFIHNKYHREQNRTPSCCSAMVFPETQAQIQQALGQWGSVFVKLNWKSGKDCKSWVSGLECTHIEDVLNVLKCSEYIGEILWDYEHLFPQHLYLILRKYSSVNVNLEFRCFVNEGVISASQRYPQNPFIDLDNKDHYHVRIKDFIVASVIPNFHQKRFVVDVLVELGEVRVVDIGPWREFTNPLLFQWEELEALTKGELRVVSCAEEIMYEDTLSYNNPNQEEILELMRQINKPS